MQVHLIKKLLAKYGKVTAEALVESALEHIRILEKINFYDIKISLKAHDVPLTLDAYRLMSETVDYPLHLGITEAGTVNTGIIKSAVGIGALLAEGIGDTFRISLTGDPVNEVKVANEIFKSIRSLKNMDLHLFHVLLVVVVILIYQVLLKK